MNEYAASTITERDDRLEAVAAQIMQGLSNTGFIDRPVTDGEYRKLVHPPTNTCIVVGLSGATISYFVPSKPEDELSTVCRDIRIASDPYGRMVRDEDAAGIALIARLLVAELERVLPKCESMPTVQLPPALT